MWSLLYTTLMCFLLHSLSYHIFEIAPKLYLIVPCWDVMFYFAQTERKRHARKDRVYQHVQTQIADQAIARKAKKITKEDKVSCTTSPTSWSSQVFFCIKTWSCLGGRQQQCWGREILQGMWRLRGEGRGDSYSRADELLLYCILLQGEGIGRSCWFLWVPDLLVTVLLLLN